MRMKTKTIFKSLSKLKDESLVSCYICYHTFTKTKKHLPIACPNAHVTCRNCIIANNRAIVNNHYRDRLLRKRCAACKAPYKSAILDVNSASESAIRLSSLYRRLAKNFRSLNKEINTLEEDNRKKRSRDYKLLTIKYAAKLRLNKTKERNISIQKRARSSPREKKTKK